MLEVAIVGDNLQMRMLIQRVIACNYGYKIVIETINGFQLLKQLKIKKIPDIAFIDVYMPIMDGISVTNFLTNHYPSISIIGISLHEHFYSVEDLLIAGAKGVLIKTNVNDKTIKEALEQVINNKIYIDKDVKLRKNYIEIKNSETVGHKIKFSTKERMFLQLLTSSISYGEIANIMSVSHKSIYNYQKSLKEKIGLSTRHEFIIYAIQNGIAKIGRIY